MEQTAIQIGNSTGVIIPASLKKKYEIEKGSKLYWNETADGKSLILSTSKALSQESSVTPEFLRIVEKVHIRYANAFKELSQK